jgi:hypothetical protein
MCCTRCRRWRRCARAASGLVYRVGDRAALERPAADRGRPDDLSQGVGRTTRAMVDRWYRVRRASGSGGRCRGDAAEILRAAEGAARRAVRRVRGYAGAMKSAVVGGWRGAKVFVGPAEPRERIARWLYGRRWADRGACGGAGLRAAGRGGGRAAAAGTGDAADGRAGLSTWADGVVGRRALLPDLAGRRDGARRCGRRSGLGRWRRSWDGRASDGGERVGGGSPAADEVVARARDARGRCRARWGS